MVSKSGRIWPLCVLCFLNVVICACPVSGGESDKSSATDFPVNIMEDSATFRFYLNEEVFVTAACEWKPDGTFSSEYTMSMAGQSATTTMQITPGKDGHWQTISMDTPNGPVEVGRDDTLALITAQGGTRTLTMKPATVLFENFSPSLISHAILAYDHKTGGKQTFPLFIIPAVVMDATLEKLDDVSRSVKGGMQTFSTYRYGLPGVDVFVWVDDRNRVCYGDVPAQHGAYVRDGYEVLMKKPAEDTLISQPVYEIIVDDEVGVPMRDGIELATDIYRPDSDRQFPVVLVRTPYKKEMNELQGKYFARRGYVYAVQDCRGRFASPGEWDPFFDEPDDGYDAVEWLAARPWSSGKVGMIGASYLGWVQWWAARGRPPHLTTIIPNVSPPDPYFNIPYEYGSLFLLGAIWWADVLEQEATGDITGKAMLEIVKKEYRTLLDHLPVVELDSIVLGKRNPYWREWIAHPDNDEYWDRASFIDRLDGLDIPVYHQSGWFDGDGIGSKLNYLAMESCGHKNQKLVLGPWGHSATATRRGPLDTDFGPDAIIDLEISYTRWLDRWLLGIENGIEKEPLVSLFVMESNKWLQGDIYPLRESEFTKFYLASDGHANTSDGDGRLSIDAPNKTGAASDTYVYDPGDATPTPLMYFDLDAWEEGREPGEDSCEIKSVEAERAKHRAFYGRINKERDDILVYDTPPLDEALTLAGPVSAVLYAASSAVDTDWHMRLAMIREDGEIFPLVRGVIRARYRNSFSEPELGEPGEIYEYHIDLWQTGITVPAGAILRVEVASAAFPMFSRNLNTGGHNETETDFISATQTIYHDPEHPSHILLPVIPDPKFERGDTQ